MPKHVLALPELYFLGTFQTKYPLTTVGNEYPSHHGIRLPRNWPLKKLFHQAYIDHMENGQVSNLKMKYSFKEKHLQLVDINSNNSISMMDIFTNFVFFGFLATIAIIILLCECGFYNKPLNVSKIN